VSKPKDRSKNPETILVPMMADVAEMLAKGVSDRAIAAYLDGAAEDHGFADFATLYRSMPRFVRFAEGKGGKSANHPAMSAGLGLFHPDTRDMALEDWEAAATLELGGVGFELNEPGSRLNYGSWSLAGRLLLARFLYREVPTDDYKVKRLLPYAKYWLQTWLQRAALAGTHVAEGAPFRALTCGSRSGGFTGLIYADVAAAIGLRLSLRWSRDPAKGYPPFWKRSPEVRIFQALARELQEHGAAARASQLGRFKLWEFRSAAETWYLRTSEGVAVWLDDIEAPADNDDAGNSNTRAIAAMVHLYADRDVFPEVYTLPPAAEAAVHIRSKAVHERVTTVWVGTRPVALEYEQGGAARLMRTRQDLPKGEIVYLIRHGRNGWEVVV
jgi:hypothetical protein